MASLEAVVNETTVLIPAAGRVPEGLVSLSNISCTALIPVAGWIVLAAVAIVALGVAVVTRFGSPGGWSLEELEW